MSSKLAIATAGDPRRPDEVILYQPPKIDPEKEPPNLMLLGASLVGLAGLYLKIKVCSWLAVIMTLSALATVRKDHVDVKQFVMTGVFAVMGIVSAYFLRKVVPTARHGKAA